ncbi:hypothetical protein MTO96_043637 [Rhipicephalus appendiculatus]
MLSETSIRIHVYFMGDKAEDFLASLKFTEEETNSYNDILRAFENHFVVRRNVLYERATFFRREQREGGVEEFALELQRRA